MISTETIRKAMENMYPIPKIGRGDEFADLSSFLLSGKKAGLLYKYYILMVVDLH